MESGNGYRYRMHRERASWDGSLVLSFFVCLRGFNGKHTELLIALGKKTTRFRLLLIGLLQFPMAQHEKESKNLETTNG